MARSLSPLESKLILHLEWEKQSVVTIEEAMRILGRSYNHTRQILHRLARRKWLAPITSGKYELIPAERGEHAFVDMNPLFVGSTLVEPYYFSFATAAFFHGLSTQASATVYIATTAGGEGGSACAIKNTGLTPYILTRGSRPEAVIIPLWYHSQSHHIISTDMAKASGGTPSEP